MKGLFSKITQNDWQFLIITFIILFLCYFPFINVTNFCFDDYYLSFVTLESKGTTAFSVQSGRWFGSFVYIFFSKFIGDGGFKGIYLSYFMVLLQFVFAAFLLAKQFKLDTGKVFSAVLISLGFIHLFNAEIMTFKFGLVIDAGLTFLNVTGVGGWFLLKKFDRNFALGVLGIIAALGTYQVIINPLIVLTLTLLLFEVLNELHQNKKLNFDFFKKSESIMKLIGIVVALSLYIPLNSLILKLYGVSPSGRSEFLAIAQIGERMYQLASVFKDVLVGHNAYLIPFFTKIVTLIVLGYALVFSIGKAIVSKHNFISKALVSFLIIILAIAMVISTLFISIPLKDWWPAPRMFTGFGFMVMGFAIIAWRFASNKMLKGAVVVLVIFMSFSHISVSHNIASDQAYRNLLDRNKAFAIMQDIYKIEDYKSKRVYIHQRADCWADESNIRNRWGDLNLSSFCTSWSKYELLEFVSGTKLLRTTNVENIKLSEAYNNLPDDEKVIWPQKGGIVEMEEIIAIYP